jgi:hypothetical protein
VPPPQVLLQELHFPSQSSQLEVVCRLGDPNVTGVNQPVKSPTLASVLILPEANDNLGKPFSVASLTLAAAVVILLTRGRGTIPRTRNVIPKIQVIFLYNFRFLLIVLSFFSYFFN